MKTRALTAWALCAVAASGCRGARPQWSVAEVDPETRRPTLAGDVVGGAGRYGSVAWLGIPFAAPPVGPLRWKPPQPAAAWSGQRQALAFAPACTQLASLLGGGDGAAGGVTGSEDCLYLNVWAPKVSLDALASGGVHLPVMVWIHGGGNSIGSAAFYDGGHLAASQNVLVVTLQYRLGPFGWLRHPALREGADAREASGNFGTLDLVAALEWVKANIAGFGGDPDSVTVFGESAGGVNVFSLLLSPLAKGLFHRAIVQSGGLSRTTVDEAERFVDQTPAGHKHSSGEAVARLLVQRGLAADRAAAKAKLSAMPAGELRQFLRGLPAAEVLAAYREHQRAGMLDMPLVLKDGAVLPEGDWEALLARPDGWNQVPVITGTNRDEAKLFLFLDPARVRRVLGLFPRLVDEPDYLASADAMSKLWKAGAVDGPATAMRTSGATEVFAYRFDWAREPTVAGADLSKLLGAAHGVEIPFVFGHFDLGKLGGYVFDEATRPSREQLSESMMGYWAEFARSGRPGRGPRGDAPEWTAYATDEGANRQLVLDVPEGGGVRMSPDFETPARVVQAVDEDARLPTQKDKCRLLHALVSLPRGLDKAVYASAGKQGCGEFPFEKYPWADRR